MKWLIWSPAIAIVFSAFVAPGGLIVFGLPLLALVYFVLVVIALGGSEEPGAATPARTLREQREPASQQAAEWSVDEKAA